jgi:hypothetical protein
MVSLMKDKFLLCLLLSTLLIWSNLLYAKVTVSADRNPVRVNESFQLYFETDESIDVDPDFSPLQQHFQILNRSQSNNISIINGKYQRNLKWTLQVMPKQEGDFVLPAIQFGNEKSDLFRVTVKPASQSRSADDGLIFELISDQASLYIQSQAIVTMRLMSDSNISGYQMGDLTVEDMDVVIEPLGDVKQYETRLDDVPFLVLEMQFALFPQQSGVLNIGPILAEVQYGGRARSIFDPFQTRAEVRRVSSNQLTLEVVAKPESFNAAHWFPSNDVELEEEWQGDLSQLVAGEPVTRIISLSAAGLTAAQLPELTMADIPGIKQYPDKPVFEDKRSAEGINSIRRQRTAIIPTGAGRYILPEISIPWWNLETGQQQVARIPARTIEVNRVVDEATSSQTGEELGPVITDGSAGSMTGQSGSASFWMWISVFLGAGWITSILVWWIMRGKSSWLPTKSVNSTETSLRKASKRLHRACVSNNVAETRLALLDWSNSLGVNGKFVNLNQVTRYFGNPLKQQIDRLNQSSYGFSTEKWSGDLLWSSCEKISAELEPSAQTKSYAGLQSLNP